MNFVYALAKNGLEPILKLANLFIVFFASRFNFLFVIITAITQYIFRKFFFRFWYINILFSLKNYNSFPTKCLF